MDNCSHALGTFSNMDTISVSRDFYIRKCSVCGEKEKLRRAGKMWVGYNVKAEALRDFDRREYAKDLLQPKDRKGQVNELFEHAYGSPYKKSKIGSKVDEYRIKETSKKEANAKTKKNI